jgi:Family of unknown function (DUF6498)
MMRRMRWSNPGVAVTSIVALVVSNLVPLLGVLFGDWSLFLLLVMYWIESGIIGAVNVAKMAMARGQDSDTRSRITLRGMPSSAAGRLLLIPFFIFHYGIFWVVHGVFVLTLPIFMGIGSTIFAQPEGVPTFALEDLGTIEPRGVLIATAGLAISHIISFFVNYVGRGEYLTVSPGAQMFSVYGRVVVLHLTILLGAAAVGVLGTPLGALVVFVLGKIALDLAFHLREHRRAQEAAALDTPATAARAS